MAHWSKSEQRKYLNYGAPGEIRTPGLLVRSQALYPTELRAQWVNGKASDLTGDLFAASTPYRVEGANIITSPEARYPSQTAASRYSSEPWIRLAERPTPRSWS